MSIVVVGFVVVFVLRSAKHVRNIEIGSFVSVLQFLSRPVLESYDRPIHKVNCCGIRLTQWVMLMGLNILNYLIIISGGFPFGSQYPQQYQQYPGFQQPFGGGGGANTFGTAGSQSQNLGGLQSQLTNAGSQTNAFQNGVGGFGANGAAQVLGGTNGLSSGASADTQKFNFGPGGFSGGSSNSNSQSSGFNSGFSG